MEKQFDSAPWEKLGVGPETIQLLEKQSFFAPTPVQIKAIPPALEGKDLLVSANTGSGKTAGFCFPMIERLRGRHGTLGLILCPTREIALQTQVVLEQFAGPQGISSLAVIGGAHMRTEEKKVRECPNILVATPGRICDHLERGNIWFEFIEVVVLDEADRMLDMGFSRELNMVMDEVSTARQTLLFSATIAGETEKLASKYLRDPERVSLSVNVTVADTIQQELLWINDHAKNRELARIIDEEEGSMIIFTRTKTATLQLWRQIHSRGYHDSDYLSSDKLQKHRVQTLDDFRSGKTRILFATDVAGRGIHVDDVKCVVNYDFPLQAEDYVHRVGRTGRKEASGRAITFVTPHDSPLLVQVEKLLKMQIPEKRARDYSFEKPRSPRRGRSGSSSGSGSGSQRRGHSRGGNQKRRSR